MTLYSDDPDVYIVYPITDDAGEPIDFAPLVRVAGFADITGLWVGEVGSSRDLRVPLSGLTAGPVHRLRLVVPGDNDVVLGDVVLT